MAAAVNKFRELIMEISPRRYFILAALFAFAVFFIGLGSRHLSGGDEPRVAGIAAEIFLDGNWLEPRLNDNPFHEKPPLYFWADALSMQLFGRNEFAAKLPSALAAFLGALSLFALARGLGMSGFGALLSVVLLSTAAQYWNYGRKCMVDIFLAVFIAFAMWGFWKVYRSEKTKDTLLWFTFFALTLGGALFSKGLIGVAVPCSALFFYLAVNDFYIEKKFHPKHWILLFAGAILSFIPVALWIWALYEKSGYEAVHTVVWTNNFGRFTGSHAEHVEPFWYYLPKLFEQLQPWTILLPFALWFGIRKVIREKDGRSLFMLCWLVIPYLLLAVSAGKRQVYVLPLYAAEVLLIADMLDQVFSGKFRLPHQWDYIDLSARIAGILLCLGLFGGAIAFIIIAAVSGMDWSAYIAPGSMLVCGVLTLSGMFKEKISRTAFGLLAGLALTYISVDTSVRPIKNARKSYHNIFKYCEEQMRGGEILYLYRPIERESGAALFYLGVNCPLYELKKTKAAPGSLVLVNRDFSGRFIKAGFTPIKEFKVDSRKYQVMKYGR
ncbi:MAG: glycosyltransferase family 39 protein [Victivallaceae bacterium]|nr:glycosyltransferase family 39 protein [Victivallaceae bacterium]